MREPANQSLSPIEPVSGAPKRKLENNEQRPGPKKRPSRTRCPQIGVQRPRHVSLSGRNVGGTHTPGNRTVETGLPRKREVAPMDPATLEITIKGHLKELRERLDHAASIARAA
jgi:D-tyrosyl-tRNA(Tyr) deacylase